MADGTAAIGCSAPEKKKGELLARAAAAAAATAPAVAAAAAAAASRSPQSRQRVSEIRGE